MQFELQLGSPREPLFSPGVLKKLDRIGPYYVHPAAAMLPEMDGQSLEELKGSIQNDGQRVLIIVNGKVLIDGRNRLRACLALNIQPKVTEYHGQESALLIYHLNVMRRDLTVDQKAQLLYAFIGVLEAEQARQRQKAAGAIGAAHGSEGGRGHKKTP
jgi:hypothetical protein